MTINTLIVLQCFCHHAKADRFTSSNNNWYYFCSVGIESIGKQSLEKQFIVKGLFNLTSKEIKAELFSPAITTKNF